MIRFFIFTTLIASTLAMKSYDGYKVFRVIPKDRPQLDKLFGLEKTVRSYVEFWKSPSKVGNPVDIMVGPDFQNLVLGLVNNYDLEVKTTVDNLQKDIDHERSRVTAGFSYEDFNTLEDIEDWMNDFATQYPDMVEVVEVGISYEGRIIKALKLGTQAENKPALWYEGGIHPREWISPATVIYMTKLFMDTYEDTNNPDHADVRSILDDMYVYMLPVYNVDGYLYTWTNDRMWRKTRSDNERSSCMGTDPNRNWDFMWGDESNFKCSDLYQGTEPFSEIEVKSVTDYIKMLNAKDGVKAFIDIHAYGYMWMTPWGYTGDILPPDYDEQIYVTDQAMERLTAVYGTEYRTGSIANVIYEASGSSADWAYGAEHIVHSYAVELRGRSFVIDREEIVPSGIETFEAIKYISKYVHDHYGN